MSQNRKSRIAIIDRGFISPYFDEFFTILNRRSDREYVIFHGDPLSATGLQAAKGPFSFPNVKVKNIELYKSAVYQPLVNKVMRGNFDAVIIGHELKFLSNWPVALRCKLRGIPVIYWGYGYHAPRGIGYRVKASKSWSAFASNLKDWIARTGEGYLAFTDRGAERMRAMNLKYDVHVVRPSVNVDAQDRLYERFRNEDRGELRRQLGLRQDSIVFIYIGRLVEAKNVLGMVDVVEQLNTSGRANSPVEAVIIGGGEDLEPLKERARTVEGIHVLGEIYDQEELARYLAVSDGLMLPGAAGITVTHAFAHGTPVLMRKSLLHSPEADYVIDGENGLISDESMDDLVRVAEKFVNSPELRSQLAAGALRTREKFSIERMAEQFHNAVDHVLNQRRRTPVGVDRVERPV